MSPLTCFLYASGFSPPGCGNHDSTGCASQNHDGPPRDAGIDTYEVRDEFSHVNPE
jgi:hypothetical protein